MLTFIPSQTHVSIFKQVCIKSEHAMGYLKGWFSSLQGLHQQIDDAADHKHALAWVNTCIIIHMLSFIEEGDQDDEFMAELVQEGTDAPGDVIGQADWEPSSETQQKTQGQNKCTELKRMLSESLYL